MAPSGSHFGSHNCSNRSHPRAVILSTVVHVHEHLIGERRQPIGVRARGDANVRSLGFFWGLQLLDSELGEVVDQVVQPL